MTVYTCVVTILFCFLAFLKLLVACFDDEPKKRGYAFFDVLLYTAFGFWGVVVLLKT